MIRLRRELTLIRFMRYRNTLDIRSLRQIPLILMLRMVRFGKRQRLPFQVNVLVRRTPRTLTKGRNRSARFTTRTLQAGILYSFRLDRLLAPFALATPIREKQLIATELRKLIRHALVEIQELSIRDHNPRNAKRSRLISKRRKYNKVGIGRRKRNRNRYNWTLVEKNIRRSDSLNWKYDVTLLKYLSLKTLALSLRQILWMARALNRPTPVVKVEWDVELMKNTLYRIIKLLLR